MVLDRRIWALFAGVGVVVIVAAAAYGSRGAGGSAPGSDDAVAAIATSTSGDAAATTLAAPTPTTTTVVTSTTTTVATTTTAAATTTTTAPPPPPPPPTTTAPPPPATTSTTSAGGGFNSSHEADFRARINGLRSGVGVAALAGDGGLDGYARNWAQHMAQTGDFSHSDIGSLLGPWSTVGENIAWGYSVESMFNGLVGSSGHYGNMVNPSFTHFGVGVWVAADGRIWTAHVFAG